MRDTKKGPYGRMAYDGDTFAVPRGESAVLVAAMAAEGHFAVEYNLKVIVGRHRLAYRREGADKWEAYLCVEQGRDPDAWLDSEADAVLWVAEDDGGAR